MKTLTTDQKWSLYALMVCESYPKDVHSHEEYAAYATTRLGFEVTVQQYRTLVDDPEFDVTGMDDLEQELLQQAYDKIPPLAW